MRIAPMNLNAGMCAENPDYIVRITGSDDYGKSKLDYFISVSSPYPVIATTSKLLSTGADCKMTKLIMLDENIGSMTKFKQVIGRGTRLREKEGKTHFVIIDFRDVTIFFYPNWVQVETLRKNLLKNTIPRMNLNRLLTLLRRKKSPMLM